MEYLDFSGEIPAGEYGGGRMLIHDQGTYRCEKWQDREVVVELRGTRTTGRYVLFATGGRDGRDWMVRRTDPPPPGWTAMPDLVAPMPSHPGRPAAHRSGRLGVRAAVGRGTRGRVRLRRAVAAALRQRCGDHRRVSVVAVDGRGPGADGGRAGRRAGPHRRAGQVRPARGGRSSTDAQYLLVDLLWLEGVSSLELPYPQRRELLDSLALAGPHWQTPPWFPGAGAETMRAARDQGLPGVVAKRLDSGYEPGRRSRAWQQRGRGLRRRGAACI